MTRAERVLRHLDAAGTAGSTVKELDAATGLGHGTLSGALSALHRNGDAQRLIERRGGACVYVHTAHLDGRPHHPPRSRTPAPVTPAPAPAPDHLRIFLRAWLSMDTSGWSRAAREPRRFIDALRRHLADETARQR